MAAEPVAQQTGPVVVLITADSMERVVPHVDSEPNTLQTDHQLLSHSAGTTIETSCGTPVLGRDRGDTEHRRAVRLGGRPRRPTR
ncbi:UNVERIFIED_CONTAM: hypothetical protein RF653_05170 [Kocuria sp. CPCC 205316]|uniref:hypothetical protein n=1 Tax=Kocuria TaxID=57493 RepID=UPI0036D763E0